jgi:hypothetical protein
MYLLGSALAMMADNIEHVITYWVFFSKVPISGSCWICNYFALVSFPLVFLFLRRAGRSLRPTTHRSTWYVDVDVYVCIACLGVFNLHGRTVDVARWGLAHRARFCRCVMGACITNANSRNCRRDAITKWGPHVGEVPEIRDFVRPRNWGRLDVTLRARIWLIY